jgi:hypothetical protein
MRKQITRRRISPVQVVEKQDNHALRRNRRQERRHCVIETETLLLGAEGIYRWQ